MRLLALPAIALLAGCAPARFSDVPAVRPPVAAAMSPQRYVSSLAVSRAAAAPVDLKIRFFDATAYNARGEGEHSNEVFTNQFPATLQISFADPSLTNADGFKVYVSRFPGPKTNSTDIGKAMTVVWGAPTARATNIVVTWPGTNSARIMASTNCVDWSTLTNVSGGRLILLNVGGRLLSSPDARLTISKE